MTIYIMDTETTSLTDPRCIELAWIKTSVPLLNTVETFEQRYSPEVRSSLGALMIHNILYSELEGKPNYKEAKMPNKTEYLIGHNVDFDAKVLGILNSTIKRICTKALSSFLFPKLDSHRQSAMIYFFEGETEETRNRLVNAHSALPDVENCKLLLQHLVNVAIDRELLPKNYTIDQLYRLSEKARIPTIMPFGKHKGELLKDVPEGYKSWLLKQPDVDPYLAKALQG